MFGRMEKLPGNHTLTYPRNNRPISADQLYSWINRHLPDGPKPELVRPVNYMRIVSAITILMGAVTLFTVLSPYVLPIIQSRNLWAAVSLIAILLFTSGQMFNHIRKVPYVAGDGNGGISYFAGGFQNQFGLETQIVAAICKLKSFPECQYPYSRLLTLVFYRCCSLIRNHCSCIEGSAYGGCQGTAGGCFDLGWCPLRHVQLPAQCVQDQEWWLSVLPSTILRAFWPIPGALARWK